MRWSKIMKTSMVDRWPRARREAVACRRRIAVNLSLTKSTHQEHRLVHAIVGNRVVSGALSHAPATTTAARTDAAPDPAQARDAVADDRTWDDRALSARRVIGPLCPGACSPGSPGRGRLAPSPARNYGGSRSTSSGGGRRPASSGPRRRRLLACRASEGGRRWPEATARRTCWRPRNA